MTASTLQFRISKTFNAPRVSMWRAWTDPQMFGKWFGPKGATAHVKRLDLRTGGIMHTSLQSPGGPEMWGKFIYREVIPPARLSWEHSFSDKDGGITRHPFQPQWPLKLLTTVIFEEEEGQKTKVTLTWVPLEATDAESKAFADNMQSMQQGWGGTFEQLEEYLARLEKAA